MGMILQKIALSKWGQKLYKHAADSRNTRFYSVNLPVLETLACTFAYCWATAKQKNIDDRRRHMLQIQNIGSGVAGVAVGSFLNRKVYDWGEKIIPKLNKELIPDAHKVINGLRVAIPIFSTALLMRVGIPCIIAYISGKVEERRHRDTEKKKLNVVA